jgi:hypothetical protein
VVVFVVGRRKDYGGFLKIERGRNKGQSLRVAVSRRTATIATLIIVYLCYLYRINYTESPGGTTRRCEFDFARPYDTKMGYKLL